jgi:hypothetical protein
MNAWNDEHVRQYKHASNFHKDYHRFEKAVEKLKAEADRLREEAWAAELEDAE